MDTYKHRIIFSSILAILNLLNSQEMIYDEGLAPRLKSRAVKAELGNDIEAPAGSIIILDASRSRPDNGSENIIFAGATKPFPGKHAP